MIKRLFSIFCLFFIISGQAQNFVRPNEWKKYRKEIYGGVGAANFLGDLGGLNKVGTDYSPVDLEFVETRTAFGIGYRYKAAKWLNLSLGFNYLIVRGDDKLTTEIYRNNRNLNFKSNIFELGGRVELVYMNNKVGHRYGIKRTLSRRMKNRSWDISAFVGIAGFYFNPKGRDASGKWVKLKPLHTEGQGLPDGPKQYSNYALAIPFGAAYRMYFNRKWVVGIEIAYRKTFTDYIDDVSTVYYDKTALADAYGTKAAQMSDPNLGNIPGFSSPAADGTRAQRGDVNKDSYMTIQVTVGYIIKSKKGRARLRSKF
jgi:hypothetical protein